jgi:hypothetical protein
MVTWSVPGHEGHNYFYGRTAEMIGIVAECENARARKATQFQSNCHICTTYIGSLLGIVEQNR